MKACDLKTVEALLGERQMTTSARKELGSKTADYLTVRVNERPVFPLCGSSLEFVARSAVNDPRFRKAQAAGAGMLAAIIDAWLVDHIATLDELLRELGVAELPDVEPPRRR